MTPAPPAVLLAPVSGPDARDAARRELERSEYARDAPGVLQRILDWLGDRLDSLFGGGLGGNTVLLLVVLLLAVAVVLAVRAGRPTLRRRRHAASPDPDHLAAGLDSRDHRRLASGFEADGRAAEALREWLRAAVATVEERGVLPPRPGRTGAATVREAAPALPGVAADLAAAVAAFEQVWFGGRTAHPGDVALARRAADGVATARRESAAGTAAGGDLQW